MSSSEPVVSGSGSRTRRAIFRHVRRASLLLLFTLPVAGGLLSFIQVFREGRGVRGLNGAIDVALSADGKDVYAVAKYSGALTAFRRNATHGTLELIGVHHDEENGVFGLLGASGVTVSPDGRHVYVTAETDDTLAVFSRDATRDTLTFAPEAVRQDKVGGVFGLDGASSVTVSPDDEQVFVTARIDGALAVFNRDATSDALVFIEAELDGFAGVDGLDGAVAVAASPDNRHVYVAADVDDSVVTFERNEPWGTISFTSKVKDGIAGVDGLNGASGVAVSPDGQNVYVAGRVDNAVAAFDRDAATGALTFLAVYRDGVGGVDGLAGAVDVEVNPSGTRVLAAGKNDDAVALFRRNADGTLSFLEALTDGEGGVDGLAGVFALAVNDASVYAAGHDEDALAGFGLALCEGDEASGDSDRDAFCDDVDLCLGDDLTGDADSDGVCDDVDLCPGFDDSVDSDGDNVPDGCELCTGDDATGDSDNDGVCDDSDVCPGASDSFDSDGDGVPNGCDVCAGNDATGDTDGDGVCDDVDVCPVFDDHPDEDGDGVPDGCDVCAGDATNSCELFSDGFESGTTSAWSAVSQGPPRGPAAPS